jgi:very-short-patch-repair endonuclease
MSKQSINMKSNYIPYNLELTKKAQMNRRRLTFAEKIFWFGVLKQSPFNQYKFTKQKPLLNYIVDFYCSSLRLVIEIDGDTHEFQREYDEVRTDVLKKHGLRVIRYENEEVIGKTEQVSEDLKSKLELT